MFSSKKNVETGYAAIRLLTDAKGESNVPVGVIGWDTDRKWFALRVLDDTERLPGVGKAERKQIQFAAKQLRRWADSGEVPYFREQREPWSSGFWARTRQALNASVRVDQPKALERELTLDEKLEALYEAVVHPEIQDRQKRIDGKIGDALGELKNEFRFRHSVPAFGGEATRVLRSLEGRNTRVIVDGVNLAGANAEDDADALVSRIRRIRAAANGRDVVSLVGYMASPNGINGETHMKQWIEHDSESETFDVDVEGERLHDVARRYVKQVHEEERDQGSLDFDS